MVYFENAIRWSFFHHNLKMRGPSCKKKYMVESVYSAVRTDFLYKADYASSLNG
jgi:hypothetical protein